MPAVDPTFAVRPEELTLRYRPAPGRRTLSFRNASLPVDEWRDTCTRKLAELIGLDLSPAGAAAPPPDVSRLRETTTPDGVRLALLVMRLDDDLSIPAYLLTPAAGAGDADTGGASPIVALHGHGSCEEAMFGDDYHRNFPLELARAGHVVLCPELRGFGALANLSAGAEGYRLDYWTGERHKAYSLVTDALQRGQTLMGQTVEDLLRWERWLADALAAGDVTTVGISYGGDLALTYPVFSRRVRGIFASGTLGSFEPVFARCYNAPAHCVPGVVEWLDRADVAGLNAPRPITFHYGELDRPSVENLSASYNESVAAGVDEVRAIYAAQAAEASVRLVVTKGVGHVMDVAAALEFLDQLPAPAPAS